MKQKIFGAPMSIGGTPKPEKKPAARSAAPQKGTSPMTELSVGPRPFNFPDVRDAAPGKGCVSGTVRMKDLSGPTPIGVVGRGSYRINRGPWLKANGVIADGDLLQLMLKPADTAGSSRRMRVWVGQYYTDFKVVTSAE